MAKLLEDAVESIKQGDKATGKKILLDILNDDPGNDRAWVLMSAVVDTNEMRYDCLQEAIKLNPDNRIAQRGLKKLQQSMNSASPAPSSDNKTAIEPIRPEPKQTRQVSSKVLTSNNQATIEYLCKRLIIEKFYAILISDDKLAIPILNLENFTFSVPVEVIPELFPLQPYFDLILFRQTGARFDAICLKVCRDKGEPPPITQAQFIEVGQACLQYSNVVAYGQVMPVIFQVWEIYERNMTPDDIQRLKTLKRLPGLKKVGVQTRGIDKISGKLVYTSAWFKFSGINRYIQRLFDEESTFSEEQTILALANSRIEVLPIIAGIVTGTALGIGLRLLAITLGWNYDLNIDVFIVFIVAAIAIYLPKFKLYSRWQGTLASAGFGVVLYGLLFLFPNYTPSLWYIIYIIVFAFLGRFLGSVVEP